jgi:adenosylcobinamide-GDP ribazoletransferase
LIIGILLACAGSLLKLLFPATVSAVIVLACYIALTGGLHLDGLGDTADGLFSNRPRERVLEIMKDSRVGTNAVLVVVTVLLLNISILSSMGGRMAFALLLMPVAGRIGSVIGAGISRYAGISNGPGRWCVECCNKREITIGLIIYFLIFFAAGALYSVFAGTGDRCARAFSFIAKGSGSFYAAYGLLALIPPITAALLAKFLGKKLNGVTGDILGAVCELNQVIFLAAAYLLF